MPDLPDEAAEAVTELTDPAGQDDAACEGEPEAGARSGGVKALWGRCVGWVRGVSRRNLLIAAAALVLVVAVGVGLGLGLRSGGSTAATTTDVAPDFVDEPGLGPQMQVAELLGGQFPRTDVLVFTDPTHALLWGSDPGKGGALVGLANLGTRTLDWKLDLAAETGFETVANISARAAGNGSAVLSVADLAEGSDKTMIVVLSGDGKVTGTRDTGSLVDAVDGYVVVSDDDEVVVTKTNLSEVWRAKVHPKAFPDDSMVLKDGSAFYVLAEGGYVDGRTGKPVGYGDDIDKVVYQILPGSVAVRVSCAKDGCSAVRFDPKTGKDMWDAALTGLHSRHGMVVVDGTLVVQDYDGETVRGVTTSDGKQQWSTKVANVDYLVHLNSGYVVAVTRGSVGAGDSPAGVLVDPEDGRAVVTVDKLWGFPAASGKQVFYTVYDDQLRAFSATGKTGEQLWSVRVDGSNYGAFQVDGGRLFVVGRLYLEQSVQTSIWEVVDQ
ncbi:MAG: PQQ-binding-like beta-propeller repeat protein [Micrococcales bacterium]|nr:PQQ-binding-like beta-propeller repeat protein [Micrococcales bacterium]MCL2666994.1 PQQ-binding-like beta-propeller repeat protein [Micrococcales bacterium]